MPRLIVTARVVPRTPILVTLMKEALSSSETSVLKEPRGVTSQKTPFFWCICLWTGVFMSGVRFSASARSFMLAGISVWFLFRCVVSLLFGWRILFLGWSQLLQGLRHQLSSPAETLESWVPIPTRGMDICEPIFCVCVVPCTGRGLASGWSPIQGVLLFTSRGFVSTELCSYSLLLYTQYHSLNKPNVMFASYSVVYEGRLACPPYNPVAIKLRMNIEIHILYGSPP
jgi:hypothetical protein